MVRCHSVPRKLRESEAQKRGWYLPMPPSVRASDLSCRNVLCCTTQQFAGHRSCLQSSRPSSPNRAFHSRRGYHKHPTAALSAVCMLHRVPLAARAHAIRRGVTHGRRARPRRGGMCAGSIPQARAARPRRAACERCAQPCASWSVARSLSDCLCLCLCS